MNFGIDISRFNNINLTQAKSEGVEYVFLRCGGADDKEDRFYPDVKFDEYYTEAKKNFLPVGTYYLCHAFTNEEAVEEAYHCVELIKGKKLDLPIFYDVEGEALKIPNVTEKIITFFNTLKSLGYDKYGVYASLDPMNRLMNLSQIQKETGAYMWVAYYGAEKPILKDDIKVDMWQFGGGINYIRNKYVAGVNVDQNYMYTDMGEFTPENEPIIEAKYSIGEVVNFDKIYISSTSTEPLTPYVKVGTITNIIEGAPNPYLINGGTGWINKDCIIKEEPVIVEEPIKTENPYTVGTKIKVKNGAIDMNFKVSFASSVYEREFEIISESSDYVVFGHDGAITGKISKDDVIIIGEAPTTPSQSSTFIVGDKVKVINPIDVDGIKFVCWYDVYDVLEVDLCMREAAIGIKNGDIKSYTARVSFDNIKEV